MAPEIGQQNHDNKTDLYSVGGVLLNILTTSFLSEHEFYKKLGQIKEAPEILNEVLDLAANVSADECKNVRFPLSVLCVYDILSS